MSIIYFDNASTTKPCEESISAVNDALVNSFGNPSSLHKLGIRSELMINKARLAIASALGCKESSIFFTSGATESNNTAILGIAASYGKRKKKIVTTSIEHPSISEPIKKLESEGFEIVRISPDANGEIKASDIINAVDSNTFLVSCMLVNNETGYILPLKEAFTKIKKRFPEVITHCDAVQGFLKIPFSVKDLPCDVISLSGHKVFAPKGIGAIYVQKGIRVSPFIIGGGQEKGLRSGTESVPLICGFGASVEKYSKDIKERFNKVLDLKNHLIEKLSSLEGVVINTQDSFSPYIISLSVLRIKAETLLHFLEERDIYVSSGSACSKGKKSEILKAFGFDDKRLDSTIRISLTHQNTKEEIDELVLAITEAQKNLAKIN